MTQGIELENSAGKWIELNAPINIIPLHLRGGFILPVQDPLNYRNTTFTYEHLETFFQRLIINFIYITTSRKNPFSLIVSLDKNNKAEGNFFWVKYFIFIS